MFGRKKVKTKVTKEVEDIYWDSVSSMSSDSWLSESSYSERGVPFDQYSEMRQLADLVRSMGLNNVEEAKEFLMNVQKRNNRVNENRRIKKMREAKGDRQILI